MRDSRRGTIGLLLMSACFVAGAQEPPVVGVEMTGQTSECVLHNGYHLLRWDMVSKKPVPGGSGGAFARYTINVPAPSGYKPYAGSLIVRSEGICRAEDTLDQNQNVIARSPLDRFGGGGTMPGENCGIWREDNKEIDFRFELQGHDVRGTGGFPLGFGGIQQKESHAPAKEEVTVYWEPLDKNAVCEK